MSKLRKIFGIFMTVALTMSFSGVTNISMAMAVAIPVPSVSTVGTSYMVGNKVSISLTSTGTKLVQYNVVLTNLDTKKIYDLTKGFTSKYYNPKYKYPLTFTLTEAGKYTLSITSKLGGYNSSYSKTISKQFKVLSNGMIIDKISPVTVKANIGDAYILPTKVIALMKDGSNKELDIKWENAVVNTEVLGEQYFYGTVQGYSGKIKLTLNIVDEKIVLIDPIEATVDEGKSYKLPETITAKLKNGTKQALVKWNYNIVDTSTPGIYKFTGTVVGYSETVNLALTVKEVPLALDNVSGLNLKEINIVFNKKIDENTVKADNFRIYKNATPILSYTSLNEDGKTVTLSNSASDFALDNKGEYVIIIEGVKDLNGKIIDRISSNITMNDNILPVVNGIYVTGPDSIQIEFSEPIKNIGQKIIQVRSGSSLLSVALTYMGFNTNKINATLGMRMTDNSNYEITVKDFTDFAGNTNVMKTQQLVYKNDATPITAVIKKADPSCVVIYFNKQVKGLTKEHFYNTIAGRTPIGIYGNPEMTTQVNIEDYVSRVWVKFYDKTLNIGYPILDSDQKVYILDKVGSNEVKDRWGNVIQILSLPVRASQDKDKPVVASLNTENENSLILEFDKEVKFNLSNLEIFDKDGNRVISLSMECVDNHKYRVNFGKSYLGNRLKVNINNVEDKAIVPNKMEAYSSTIEITDKTPPMVKKVIKKFITGLDQSIYIYYSEQVNDTALNVSNYYLQNPLSGLMVKLTEKPSIIDENKTIRLPLTGEQKELINKGYNLFVSDIQDTYKNVLPGQIVQNSKIVVFDSNENKPKIIKLEAIDKRTLTITFDQYIKRVDIDVFLLNGSAPAGMSSSVNDDGNTVVSLTTSGDREFLPDLRGLTLLNVITTADKKIENSFGLGAENGYYTTTTPVKIQDKMPPAVKVVSGVTQIRTLSNTIGIVDTIILEYEENIDSTKLSALSYNVEGRSIARVYTNSIGRRGVTSVGSFVIIELKTDGVTQNNSMRPAVTQALDIYDMFDNKLSPNGQSIAPLDNSGPAVINRISSQIYRGETRVVTFTKPLSEISKIIVQNMITANSRGKGTLIFIWGENKNLSITNISNIESTDFLLSSPTKITLTGADGTLSNDIIIIGW